MLRLLAGYRYADPLSFCRRARQIRGSSIGAATQGVTMRWSSCRRKAAPRTVASKVFSIPRMGWASFRLHLKC